MMTVRGWDAGEELKQLEDAAACALQAGNLREAEHIYRELLHAELFLARALKRARTRMIVADLDLRLGHPAEALEQVERAIPALAEPADRTELVLALALRARILRQLTDEGLGETG